MILGIPMLSKPFSELIEVRITNTIQKLTEDILPLIYVSQPMDI
jgi:hypothetical protein